MVKRRRVPAIADGGDPVALSVDDILDGRRPSRSEVAADAAWRAAHARLGWAAAGTEFDPRHVLRLTPRTRATWHARRRAWAVSILEGGSDGR